MEKEKDVLFRVVDEQIPYLKAFTADCAKGGQDEGTESIWCHSRYLEKHGFTCRHGQPGKVHAAYQSLEGGPVLGLLAIAPSQIGPATLTAVAIKECLGGKTPFRLETFFIQQGEHGDIAQTAEGLSGEAPFGEDGLTLLCGGEKELGAVPCQYMRIYEGIFTGKQAHAAAHPWDGYSAFDGMQMAYHAVEFLQKYVPRCTISYQLTDNGGTPANVVPDLAKSMFYLAAPTMPQLEALCNRLEKILSGAALMTGTTANFAAQTEPQVPLTIGICQSRTCVLTRADFWPEKQRGVAEEVDAAAALSERAKAIFSTGYDILTMPGLFGAIRQIVQKERDLSNSL